MYLIDVHAHVYVYFNASLHVQKHIRGVIGIKCSGQNNFNMNHFRAALISGLF
jgi:hypothetical protein